MLQWMIRSFSPVTLNWQLSSSGFQSIILNRSWFGSKIDSKNFSSAFSPDTDIFCSSQTTRPLAEGKSGRDVTAHSTQVSGSRMLAWEHQQWAAACRRRSFRGVSSSSAGVGTECVTAEPFWPQHSAALIRFQPPSKHWVVRLRCAANQCVFGSCLLKRIFKKRFLFHGHSHIKIKMRATLCKYAMKLVWGGSVHTLQRPSRSYFSVMYAIVSFNLQ